MGAQKKFHEEWSIVATIDPIDANNADSSADEIDMSKFSEIAVIVLLGVLNDSATNEITVQDSVTAGGSLTTITGKTQSIVGTDDAKQFVISVRSDEMNAGARYITVKQANSAHSQLMAMIILGKPYYGPATANDLSTVQTIVD